MKTESIASVVALALSCTAAALAAAPPPPKVVFVGDVFMYNWQQSATFQTNPNWIGQGIQTLPGSIFESADVAAAFQTALNLHPNIVFIETGSSDIASQEVDFDPMGAEWQVAASAIIEMVQMARKANVKVMIGNVVVIPGYNLDYFNGWLQTYAQAEKIPLVNFQGLVAGCGTYPSPSGDYFTYCTELTPTPYATVPVPNDIGYGSMTLAAQNAIATQGLTIVKGGYLSNVLNESTNGNLMGPQNNLQAGAGVQFTAYAKWNDGVIRPLNLPYSGAFNSQTLGTWWSTNPKVMAINQQGHAVAYSAGTASIYYRSANGVTFSPWVMSIGSAGTTPIPEPVY